MQATYYLQHPVSMKCAVCSMPIKASYGERIGHGLGTCSRLHDEAWKALSEDQKRLKLRQHAS